MSSDAPKKSVRVTIFNQTYTLLATSESGEIESLAHTVDELMVYIAKQSGNVDTARIAVLACLHMADQMRQVERELTELRNRVEEKAKKFSGLLDTLTQSPPEH